MIILTGLATGLANLNKAAINEWDASSIVLNSDSEGRLQQSFLSQDQVASLPNNGTRISQYSTLVKSENGLKEKHGKGDIGQAYEEGWFNYACNEEAEPDFKDADIELKVTSFLINSRGYRAKERLSLGKINYKDENWNEYEESRFWTKNHHLLVMYYQYIRGVKREEFSVEKVDEILLKELPERDQMIIQHDWEKNRTLCKSGEST